MRITALVMSGGRGSRLGSVDKGSVKLCGKPMIAWVLDNLTNAGVDRVVVSVSRRSSTTLSLVRELYHHDVYISSGVGYVEDLSFALRLLTPRPLLTMPVDTPLITPDLIIDFVRRGIGVGKPVVNMIGPFGYVGVTLFNGSMGDWSDVKYDTPLVMDVDTPEDLNKAKRLCSALLRSNHHSL